MQSRLRRSRATDQDRRTRRGDCPLCGSARQRFPYRLLAVGLPVAVAALFASPAILGGGWFAAAAQAGPEPGTVTGSVSSDSAPAPDPAVAAQRVRNLALQSAEITADDLPLDEEGRSAKTGRAIPGVRPRRPIPPEVQQALDGLRTRATRAAESLPADPESVVITDLPNDPAARRPRLDSAGPGANSQPAIAPVERNR